MKNHKTKFENKMFDGLEDIIWTNIKFWPFAVTLTSDTTIQFLYKNTLVYDNVPSNQIW